MHTDPMPVFVIKAKDKLSLAAIRQYRIVCESAELTEQAIEVNKAWQEFHDWQKRNPGLIKLPDHAHVPASMDNDTCLHHRDHQEFINELLANAPEDWMDDVWDGAIALEYIHTLERRIKHLGGHLEKYPETQDPEVSPDQLKLL